MRNIFLFMMVSLDGYFEGPDHDLSWHNVDGEFEEYVHGQNNHLDTILFGRRTYDMMANYWPTTQGTNDDRATADWMTNARKIVVSDAVFEPRWQNTEIVTENVTRRVKELKAERGTDIVILGSNMLCVSLMEEGLVDQFNLMYNPVVIGKGTPLFYGLKKKIKLKLLSSRQFKNGNVLNCYSNAT